MDSSTITIIALVLFLVFCCGPMMLMMGRQGKGDGHEKQTTEKPDKPPGNGESK